MSTSYDRSTSDQSTDDLDNDHDLDRHLRLQLPRMEGQLLSADLPAAKMLPYYAARFPTVEINYTFYRMPNEKLVGGWAAQTPSPYKLTLKAPRRITHDSRLKNCGELVARLLPGGRHARRQARRAAVSAAAEPEEGSGALRRVSRRAAAEGAARRSSSATRRGSTTRCSSGWRRGTWRCASPTARRCRRRSGSPPTTPTSGCATKATRPTTSRAGPTRSRARPPSCRDVFVYFKHEEEGKGPEFARLLMETLAGRPSAGRHDCHHMTEPFVFAKLLPCPAADIAVPSRAGQPARADHRRHRHRQDRHAAGAGRAISPALGVPVFLADVKGDLSGLAAAGSLSPKLRERLDDDRLDRAGVERATPVAFWDVFGQARPSRARDDFRFGSAAARPAARI